MITSIIIISSSIESKLLSKQLLNIAFINSTIDLIIGALSVTYVCFIERKRIVTSIIFINLGIVFLLSNMIQIISSVLLVLVGYVRLR